MPTEIREEQFITILNGKETSLHTLRNGNGMRVDVTNYGARLVTIIVADKNGKDTDVVLGYDNIEAYLHSKEAYFSALVGRYANRIANGKFKLEGKNYQLATNNPPNHLHGGPDGFHVQVWDVETTNGTSITLSYLSKDGEENFPGNLEVYVTYTVTEKNELVIDYEATTDQTTVINLTSHPYFNLNGQGSGTVENHILQINAANYTPVTETLIPRGIEPVEGTPFDFRKPKRIGENINDYDQQLKYGAGYDHNYVLDGKGFRSAALVTGDLSGITMEVLTDEPGMQLYSANHLSGENRIKYGLIDGRREAFCLETQHFPDSPNQPQFPTTVLKPGEVFRSKTVYKFSS
jgi:aldose 1-epimerase